MNVVEPRLLVADYARANYLKTEIENARRYIATLQARGVDAETAGSKSELIADFLEQSAAKFRVDVGNETDEAGGEGDA